MKNSILNITITGKTYRTYNYDIFKRLEGNRAVLSLRVKRVKRSIENNGYIFSPIVVNEKYEVIDGQARLEALKILEMPVDFVIADGAGIRECIALNANGTSWKIQDYIESYCEQEYEDYIRFNELLNNYPNIAFKIKSSIALGITTPPHEILREGRLIFNKKDQRTAEEDLNFVNKFTSYLKTIKGRNEYYYFALVFAHRLPDVDNKRLVEVVQRSVLPPVPDVRSALDNLSDAYNKGLSINNRRYFFPAYEKKMSEMYPWYDTLHVVK